MMILDDTLSNICCVIISMSEQRLEIYTKESLLSSPGTYILHVVDALCSVMSGDTKQR